MPFPPGHRRFVSLARRTGKNDAQVAKILGVTAGTVSRLRSGKIQKMHQYNQMLVEHLGAKGDSFDDVMRDLGDWSKTTPELRAALTSIHKIARDSV